MNQQALTNNQTDQINDEAELEMFLFDDLNLTDEQLAEIKGGPVGGGDWACPTCGFHNHNETTVEDDESLLDDLMLSPTQENDIKGGCPGCNWGPPCTNHNETTQSDEPEEAESLSDLSLTDEQADETKAGAGGSGGGAGKATFQDLHFATATWR